MTDQMIRNRRRHAARLALSGLRLVLALLFMTLGLGFLPSSGFVEDLARAGIDPNFRWILAAAHFAGGLALLVPRLAGLAALTLGVVVIGTTFYLRSEGVGVVGVFPAILVSVLLLFLAGLQLRRRIDASRWSEMLARYADQQDSLRSENA